MVKGGYQVKSRLWLEILENPSPCPLNMDIPNKIMQIREITPLDPSLWPSLIKLLVEKDACSVCVPMSPMSPGDLPILSRSSTE